MVVSIYIFLFLVVICYVHAGNHYYYRNSFSSCGDIGDRELSNSKCENRWGTLYTCQMHLALLSYVKDNVGSFPQNYAFNTSQPIIMVDGEDANATTIFTDFAAMISTIYKVGESNRTWSGTAENGMLTSQNCFDWALGINCFYGTTKGLTNEACDNIYYVDCFGINCIPGTYTPTTSPSTSIPTLAPTSSNPTLAPTSSVPTVSPTTSKPSIAPTTSKPTIAPSTSKPSAVPSTSPTSSIPTVSPTVSTPTLSPTTSIPTKSPTTSKPSLRPSISPSTSIPTISPTISQPTVAPSTSIPTVSPTTSIPTKTPTTSIPTIAPSQVPSSSPVLLPFRFFLTISNYPSTFNTAGQAVKTCQEDAVALGLANGRSFPFIAGFDRSWLGDLSSTRNVMSLTDGLIANNILTFLNGTLTQTLNSAGVSCEAPFWTGIETSGVDATTGCSFFTSTTGSTRVGSCFVTTATWKRIFSSTCSSGNFQFPCIWDPIKTWGPTISPTSSPTGSPTLSPTSSKPTKSPSTSKPTISPSTSKPTISPSTSKPTISPSTSKPTTSPSTSIPSRSPSSSPTGPPTYAFAQLSGSGSATFPPNPTYQQLNFSGLADRSQNSPVTPTSSPNANFFQVTTAGTYAISFQIAKLSTATASMSHWLCLKNTTTDNTCYGNGNVFPHRIHGGDSLSTTSTLYNYQSYIVNIPAGFYIGAISNRGSADVNNIGTFLSVMKLSSLTNNFYRAIIASPTTVAFPTPTFSPSTYSASEAKWLTSTPLPTSNPTLVTFEPTYNAKMTIPTTGIWSFICSSYNSVKLGIAINGCDTDDLKQRSWGIPGSRRTVGLDYGVYTAAKWAGYLVAGEFVCCATSGAMTSDASSSQLSIVYLPDLGNRVEVSAWSQIKYGSPANKAGIIWNTTSIRSADMGFIGSNFNQTDGRVSFSAPGIFTITASIQSISNDPLFVRIDLNQLGSVPVSSSSFSSETGRILGYGCHDSAGSGGFYQKSTQVTFPITSSTDYIQVIIETNAAIDVSTVFGSYDKIALSIVKTGELAPPTFGPTRSPTTSPSTSVPSKSPSTSKPSIAPTFSPSKSPTSSKPTTSPTSSKPTTSPTSSKPSVSPSRSPSKSPSKSPTSSKPTTSPTKSPTKLPTKLPTTLVPTLSPTFAPTASPTYNWVLLSFSSLTGSSGKMFFVSPTPSPSRAQNSIITPTSTPTTDFATPATDTIAFVSVQGTTSTSGIMDFYVIVGTAPPSSRWTGTSTSFPWRWQVYDNTPITYQHLSVVLPLPANNVLRACTAPNPSPTNLATFSPTRTFVTATSLATLSGNYYTGKHQVDGFIAIYTPSPSPTPTSVEFPTYPVPFPVANALAPVSSPTLCTVSPTSLTYTIKTNGIYSITTNIPAEDAGIGINGGHFESPSWQYLSSSPRVVGLVSGLQSSSAIATYLVVGETIQFITSAVGGSWGSLEAQIAIAYLGSSTHHVHLKALGAIAYTTPSYRIGITFNRTSMRQNDAGFTLYNFDETTGLITFNKNGKYMVTCWMRAATNTHFTMFLLLNQQMADPTTASFTSDTGKIFAAHGPQAGTTIRTPARYTNCIQDIVVITTKATDTVQCAAQSTGTTDNLASLIVPAQTGVTVVLLSVL